MILGECKFQHDRKKYTRHVSSYRYDRKMYILVYYVNSYAKKISNAQCSSLMLYKVVGILYEDFNDKDLN